MDMEGILSEGIGYEVSKSRWEMANRFGELLNMANSKVINVNSNFLDTDAISDSKDLVIMVDIVLQIIFPLYDEAENETLRWIFRSLKKGGHLFLEIEDYQDTINELNDCGGVVRKWEEYDESDPFQYGLHKIELDNDGNIVIDKTFIKRNSSERDNFTNVIKSYSEDSITRLLEQFGFEVKIYPYFDENEKMQDVQNGMYKRHRFRVWATKK